MAGPRSACGCFLGWCNV